MRVCVRETRREVLEQAIRSCSCSCFCGFIPFLQLQLGLAADDIRSEPSDLSRHEIDAANATAILLLSSAAPTGGKRRSSPCLTCDLWLPPPPESRLRWRGEGG